MAVLFLPFLPLQTIAQPPATINYQAVVRNAQTGNPVQDATVFISFEIASENGSELVFKENHPNASTNEFGLLSLEIGSGQTVVGSISQIRWEDGTPWLKVLIDIGNGLEILQESKFAAVPYAMYAGGVADKDDADADPTNELITDFSFDSGPATLHLSEGGIDRQVDLSSLIDGDGDPTNELIDDIQFDTATRELTIHEGDNENTVWLGPVDDADADPTNELVDSLVLNHTTGLLRLFQNGGQSIAVDLSALNFGEPGNVSITEFDFDGTTSVLTLQQGTESWSLDLSELIDDADADPTNELITDFSFASGTSTLHLSEGGIDREVDLSALIDGDGDPTNELIDTVEFDTDSRELTIREAGHDHVVSLGTTDDADADPTNELITDFSFASGTSTLHLSEGGIDHEVDLSSLVDGDGDPTNELIDTVEFDTDSRQLTIREAGHDHVVSLGTTDDADADPTNELITDFSFASGTSTLHLSEGGIDHEVDLSSLVDGDGDPTNELQDLTIDNHQLGLTDSGVTVDLSDYDQSELPEGHIFIGDESGVSVARAVSRDVRLLADGTARVVALNDVPISPEVPGDGDVLSFDESEGAWIPKSAESAGAIGFYSIDPTDFRETYDIWPSHDNPQLRFFGSTAEYAYFNGNNASLIAPVHLPHNATILEVTTYVGCLSILPVTIRLDRKAPGLPALNETIVDYSSNVMLGVQALAVGANNPLRNVDNSKFTYRLRLTGMPSSVIGINLCRIDAAIVKYQLN